MLKVAIIPYQAKKQVPENMKKYLKSTAGIISCIAASMIVLISAVLCGYTYWHFQLVKFQNVTIELGQPLPDATQFMTENAKSEKVRMVTPSGELALDKVGKQSVTLAHGTKLETVTLTIQDTTPPTVKFRDVTADIGAVLTPEDFVEEVYDLSEVTVAFAKPLEAPDGYGNVTVDLVVTDEGGNRCTGRGKICCTWIYPTYTLELGDTLEKTDLLLSPQKDSNRLDQADLDAISHAPVGTYTVSAAKDDKVFQCVVTVQDTVPPQLVLRKLDIDVGDKITKEKFIESVYDISGDVTVNLLSTLDNSQVGTQEVVLEAVDINGNKTTLSTTLTVNLDATAPVFAGMTDIRIAKNTTPDYEAGVAAIDNKDGEVAFTYDADRVDITAPGTYYVVYTASDSKGNKTTFRRKVEVLQNASDTMALANSVAAGLSDSVEEIRDYVRDRIGYSSSWGGDDPVWYGLKNRVGNCYVHAMVLDALLRAKGYPTQLIWCQDKSHYWNLVYLDGTWKHIDSTPSDHTHNKYSLMNDEQRHETLEGRDWDRELWPECP